MEVDPSAVSVVTVSSTVNSVVETTAFTVNVELLLVVPVIVIKSNAASFPDPVKTVLVELMVLTPPDAVKLMSLPVIVVTCAFDDNNVVLVCAIVVIYSSLRLLNLAVFGPNPYTAASSLGSWPSTVSILMYFIL